jgi:hypothetical protein
MIRSHHRHLRAGVLLGFALIGAVTSIPGCGDSSGNPPVGSISAVRKGSDAAPEKAAVKKAELSRTRIGQDH